MAAKIRRAMGPTRSSTAARVAGGAAENARTLRVGARGRAQNRARWATQTTPSRVLAKHYGISASRARHRRAGDRPTELSVVLEMVADPNVDAGRIVVALLEAWEERFLYQPTAELRARSKRLRENVEHQLQAEQDRAVLVRDGAAEACRQHASVLLEMACIEEVLGLTERAH